MAQNPTVILEQIQKTLGQAADANALREIRKTLDDAAFFATVSDYLRGVNDPDTKAAILGGLSEIGRLCGDKSAQRKNQLTNVRYGIGGGIAVGTAGVVGVITGGAAFVIVAAAGGIMAVMSSLKTSMLSEEEQIYADIASRAAKIREKFDVA